MILTDEVASRSWMEVIIAYVLLILLIVVSGILIALLKRKYKKEGTIPQIRAKLNKAKKYAIKIKDKTSNKELLIAAPKLKKVKTYLGDATWLLSKACDEKKDVILDDILSNSMDITKKLGDYVFEAFYIKKEYTQMLKEVISKIDEIKHQLDAYEKDNSKSKNKTK